MMRAIGDLKESMPIARISRVTHIPRSSIYYIKSGHTGVRKKMILDKIENLY
ncbi:MAG: hypothetical protein AMDU1_APLC00023G0007 [Thermoplasmatales archaeon A-plasma]|jgi:hypothetical protein|nr:MAG: hypothetical protein AMDU1_APLC00023G0007 [Thermoplasmatales archaeon A-plasma]